MMTSPTVPITPAETGELLTTLRFPPSGASLAEQAALFGWKADLLSRIAALFGTPEAHAAAAEAWGQVVAIAAKAREAIEAQP